MQVKQVFHRHSRGERQETSKRRQVLGWVAVGLSIAITCGWAFWGIIETFHEGWYYASWLANVGLMLAQYLSPMLGLMGVALVAIRWPRVGAGLHVALALFVAWFFGVHKNTVILLLLLPLVGIGALYWFGRPKPRRLALCLAIGLPILTLIAFGFAPARRVAQRLDDGVLQARRVRGHAVDLVWAPDGPGWPRDGMDWFEAHNVCHCLDDDGLTLAAYPQNIWRLPTVDEAVRSMALHGENCHGVWSASEARAIYAMTPDKESPLWNTHSQVIYWWTGTEIDRDRAHMIAYDGKVWPRQKRFGPAYLGFRCVREP